MRLGFFILKKRSEIVLWDWRRRRKLAPLEKIKDRHTLTNYNEPMEKMNDKRLSPRMITIDGKGEC